MHLNLTKKIKDKLKTKKKDTYSYKGWLNSDRITKRSFAVMGYYAIATLYIYLVVIIIYLIVAGLIWLF